MADLIAQGPERRFRWRRPLPEDGSSRWLGRSEGTWMVPWDTCISRHHARLEWRSPYLQVEKESHATNPIFVDGVAQERFWLKAGQHFVIGETTFTVVENAVQVSLDLPHPVDQQTFSPAALRDASFRHAQRQIQSLLRLPELMAAGVSDQELWVRLVNLLLTSVTHATAVALIAGDAEESRSSNVAVASESSTMDARGWRVVHWDRNDSNSSAFQPSASLIEQALRTGESVMHRWDGPSTSSGATVSGEFDWAFATPLSGQTCRGMVVYLAGTAGSRAAVDDELPDALKFTEFVTATVGSICDVRKLQRRTALLAPFFSPVVRDALAQLDPESALAPRETDVCVLFCDLRGFSRSSERSAGDLMELLERVSQSLGIVTGRILEQAGVIGDFHGDAAMGFWGWPLPQSDLAKRGCLAALAIWQVFSQLADSPEHALSDFRVGMGLATGRAVAGRIGTVDQVKVTVFGPVANIASRLEGMTRLLGASILLEENTVLQAGTDGWPADARIRLVANVCPYGMDTPQAVYELQPNANAVDADQQEETFQRARSHFVAGHWALAQALFEELRDRDPVSRFYLDYLKQHHGRAPATWDGVIRLTSK